MVLLWNTEVLFKSKQDKGTSEFCPEILALRARQSFAEKLFARLQHSGGERFEARLAMVSLVSRVVGVHRLLLVNFYPFLQRYLQPHQRDVTQLLAALVQVSTAIPPINVKCGSCAIHSAVQGRTACCMQMQVART